MTHKPFFGEVVFMDPSVLDEIIVTLDPLSKIGLAAALFIIMFSVALGLRPRDFAAVAVRPILFAGGVFAQIIGLPLLTLGLVYLLAPPASIALGMIVVAVCPGGNVSNLMTYFARGDTALSVALTATSSIIAAFLTPAFILLWISFYPPTSTLLQSVSFDSQAFLIQTTFLLAVPLGIGMIFAHWAPNLANRLRGPGAFFGAGLLIAIVIVGTYDLFPKLFGTMHLIFPPVILHNACAFVLGAITGWALQANAPSRRALTFEIGIQNSGLALVILLGQLQGLGGAAAVAATWGLWHLIGGGVIVGLYRLLGYKSGVLINDV
jgi:BASS family bile acid:Na+ symporter